jgi:hydroxyacylglutathione hydrolase
MPLQDRNHIIEEIAPDTYRIDEGPSFVNAYLLVGTKKALLIDSGLGIGNIRENIEFLTDKPIEVVMTHGHCDHTGGRCFFETYRIHKNDAGEPYRFLSSRLAVRLLARANKVKGFHLSRKRLWFPKKILIDDDYKCDLGDGRIIGIRCFPGHTQGSIVLFDPLFHLAFTGDNVNPYLWLQLPGCASVNTWLQGALTLARITQGYKLYGGHKDGFISREDLLGLIKVGEEIVLGAKFPPAKKHIVTYPEGSIEKGCHIRFDDRHIR